MHECGLDAKFMHLISIVSSSKFSVTVLGAFPLTLLWEPAGHGFFSKPDVDPAD